MAIIEIEGKYLLRNKKNTDCTTSFFREQIGSLKNIIEQTISEGDFISQYYCNSDMAPVLAQKRGLENFNDYSIFRLRNIQKANGKLNYIITLKGDTNGIGRLEEEFEISEEEYDNLTNKIEFSIYKKRLVVPHPQDKNLKVEIDVFMENPNLYLNHLVFAEVEVENEKRLNELELLGEDISRNRAFTNLGLAIENNKYISKP